MDKNNRVTLKEAVKFHGHLGPYLVLGILMGDLIINKLKFKKYFGIEAVIKGAVKKPKSCLIDGIQVSTGCTYGKGNIQRSKNDKIKVLFRNLQNKKKIEISLKEDLIKKLDNLKGHNDSEAFAKILYKTDPLNIFHLTPDTHNL